MNTRPIMLFLVLVVAANSAPAVAEGPVWQPLTGGMAWTAPVDFVAHGARCGQRAPHEFPEVLPDAVPSDCTLGATSILPEYEPGDVLVIPVVVHVITSGSGTGNLSDAVIESQIDVLNEDYLALPGTPGALGTDAAIRFELATTDPAGLPTTGITRTANDTWWNDSDEYGFKTTLGWDQNRYLNLYTNNTPYLGYSWFPQWGIGWEDGVVINYQAFGRTSIPWPYNLGRTATHEIGHYLGLLHPFEGGCGIATSPGCYTSADLICDTNPDATETYGCPATTSCGGYAVPVENYMEYTDDACMELFSAEQANRMRCSLINYRPNLYTISSSGEIFSNDFEAGNLDAWSVVSP